MKTIQFDKAFYCCVKFFVYFQLLHIGIEQRFIFNVIYCCFMIQYYYSLEFIINAEIGV
jgi:hypothetical protein